jgi:hypothetical protein
MANTNGEGKQKKKVPVWAWIVGGILVVGLAVSAGGGTNDEVAAPSVTAEADSPLVEKEIVEEAVPAEVAPEVIGITDGSYFVGDEIEPGLYRAIGSGFCYWERLSGFGGSFNEIIANGSGPQEIVSIAASDVGFTSSGCGPWVPVEETFPDSPADTFGDGVYVVGSHIQAGTYKAEINDGCYWDRLSGFGGSFREIIANGFEQPIVEIKSGDTGFASAGCGTWARQG